MISDAIKSKKMKNSRKPTNIVDLLKRAKLRESEEKKNTLLLVFATVASITIVASIVLVF